MEWTVVGRKGKKSARPCKLDHTAGQQVQQCRISTINCAGPRHYKERSPEERVRDLSCQLQRIKAEIADSEFFKKFLPKLHLAEQLWEESLEKACTESPDGDRASVSMASDAVPQKSTKCSYAVPDMHLLSADFQSSLSMGESQQPTGSLPVSGTKEISSQGELHAAEGTRRIWRWAEVEEMVIYGLGSLEASPVPRYQLAFALLLAQHLPRLQGPMQAFDPVFTEVDQMLLREQGLTVLHENDEGRRCAERPTLFYLPHCEADLCSNVVEANVGSGGLAAILGNSFALYHERWTQRGSAQTQHQRSRPDALLRAVDAGRVLEVAVSDHNFSIVSAFNDMSLHLFPPTGQLPD